MPTPAALVETQPDRLIGRLHAPTAQPERSRENGPHPESPAKDPEGFITSRETSSLTTTTTNTTTTMSGNLPSPLTPRMLDTLRTQPGMPADMWYAVAATTLCVLNRPEDIKAVYRHAAAADAAAGPGQGPGPGAGTAGAVADHARQLRIARRLREALLKTSAIGGLPKVSRPGKTRQPGQPAQGKPLREGEPRRPRLA